jgi:predicted thioesterase
MVVAKRQTVICLEKKGELNVRQVIIIAGLTLLLGAGPLAADVPADVQVKLQGAMLRHIEEIAVDGAYTYLDTRDQTVKTVYPASVHPMVVPFGEDYFVCSEVIDEDGNNLTADFLVRDVKGEYTVVQTIIDDREAMMAAMAKLGQ